MYLSALLIIIVFSILEFWITEQRKRNLLFVFLFVLLSLQLCLRFGQGTDYYGYMYNYYNVDVHSEIGFRTISMFFNNRNVPFEYFVMLLSAFQMICTFRAIWLYSPHRCFSLMLFYPTIFLTYYFSALRQGILIAFFLGFMLKWLLEKKWPRYLLGCLFFSTIHSASWILLILLIIYWVKIKHLYIVTFLAFITALCICIMPTEWFGFVEIGAVQHYLHTIEVSYIGIIEKIIMFSIVTLLQKNSMKFVSGKKCEIIQAMYKIYVIGFAISILLSPWHLLSSRLGIMMKAVEIILIPILLSTGRKWRQLVFAFIVCYSLLMMTKNIASYIQQGGYENTNVLNYPYLTIFDKDYAIDVRRDALPEGYIKMINDKYK